MKPFEKAKDGRSAWKAVTSQYAGLDKWKAMLASAEELIQNRKWNGSNTSYSLEKFIQQHRAAFVTLTQCSERVSYQLPNEHTRVTKVMMNIESNDAKLLSALANVQADEDGKMTNFEAMAAYILPYDLVKSRRKQSPSKRKTAEISEVTSTTNNGKRSKTITVSGKSVKIGIGKTGVDFQYHTPDEWKNLSREQKNEVISHRNDREKKGQGRNLPGGPTQSTTAQTKLDKKQMKSTISECIVELFTDAEEAESKKVQAAKDNKDATNATISSFLNRLKKNT